MILWIDAQLSPDLAPWISESFKIEAHAVRDLGLEAAKDREIFKAAKEAAVVVMTKDSDFLTLLEQHGPPPQIVWITCGNTSNARLKEILVTHLKQTLLWLKAGERLVEIGDAAAKASTL